MGAINIFTLTGTVLVDSTKAEQSIAKIGDKAAELGGKIEGMGKKFAPVSAAAGAVLGGLIANTAATKEYREEMGKLETAFTTNGHSAEAAQKVYGDFYAVLGETDRSVEAVNHLAKLTSNQQELSDWTTIATGVFATFGDSLPIEGLTEAANETAKVGQVTGPLADALNWAGVSEDAFNESLAACNTEQERATLITDTLNGLYGEAAAKYREVNGDLITANENQDKLNATMAKLGGVMQPLINDILTPLVDKLSEVVTWFTNLDEGTQKTILGVIAVIAGIAPLLIIIGKVIAAVSTISAALPALGAAFAVITGPVGLVVAAIAALIAIGVLLYKNWDEIKAFGLSLWEDLKTGWTEGMEGIKTAWSDFSDNIKSKWEEMWNNVTSFFDNIKNTITTTTTSLTEGMLEKWTIFKTGIINIWGAITGAIKGYINNQLKFVNKLIDALNSIQVEIPDWVPGIGGNSFGIDLPHVPYLAKGGIVTKPTLAMIGEAGPEAVIPLNRVGTGTTIKEINIYGNNADEIWAKFSRELHRLGVAF